jgi:hypothetical protein
VVRRRLEDWRALLTRRPACGRQLLREMLAEPIMFTPAGRVYRFHGDASFGALAGETGVSGLWYRYEVMTKSVPQRNVEFFGIAA